MEPDHRRRWTGMMQRCYNPKNSSYKHYGGRGIRVIKIWQDIEVFSRWCKNTYVPGCSLDRVNNDGPYSPNNCKWSTRHEQRKNTRTTERVTRQFENFKSAALTRVHALFGDPKVRKSKKCSSCKRTKVLKLFYAHAKTIDGVQSSCISCERKRTIWRSKK